MKVHKLKKPAMLVAALAIAFSSFAQSKKQTTSPSNNALPEHFPKQKTEASLQSWVKQYPREAADYSEKLMQKMMKLDQSKPEQMQQYMEMKIEYKLLTKVADQVNVRGKAGKAE